MSLKSTRAVKRLPSIVNVNGDFILLALARP